MFIHRFLMTAERPPPRGGSWKQPGGLANGLIDHTLTRSGVYRSKGSSGGHRVVGSWGKSPPPGRRRKYRKFFVKKQWNITILVQFLIILMRFSIFHNFEKYFSNFLGNLGKYFGSIRLSRFGAGRTRSIPQKTVQIQWKCRNFWNFYTLFEENWFSEANWNQN